LLGCNDIPDTILRAVHRDVKPSNLLLYRQEDGKILVRVTDFGLSKKIPKDSSSSKATKAGHCSFMAPESCFADDKKVELVSTMA